MATGACRCGFKDGEEGPHPCHANGYRCRKPAKERFYDARPVALGGVQVKFQASGTWACDDCWLDFKGRLEEVNGR